MTINIKIPKSVQYILDKLDKFGYEAYIVGGSVRDSILGRQIHDWDITTSALPEEIMNVFKNEEIIPTGLKHGTVTVLINKEPFEITTYRIDGEYLDNRRPNTVYFTKDLIEDLKRRDFTINAMAYNPKFGLIDPFNGMNDIKCKTLRCVGSPQKRFLEDALRILRLWRFSIQLGFTASNTTEEAARKLKDNLKNISKERIQSEFVKSIQGNKHMFSCQNVWFLTSIIPELYNTCLFDQNNPCYIYTIYTHSILAYKFLNNSSDLITRIATLLHDIGKPHCYYDDKDGIRHFEGHEIISADIVNKILKELKFDNNTREKVVELVYYHGTTLKVEKKCIKRLLNKIGEEQFRRLIELIKANIVSQNPKYALKRLKMVYSIENLLNEIIAKQECFSLQSLKINGNDIKSVLNIKQGKEIGYLLNCVLEKVIDKELYNDKHELLDWIRNNGISLINERKEI